MPAPWPGSGTAGPARSICTRCCRCRPPFCALGPTDPAALAWLAAHWGTTDRLRQVSERPPGTGRRLPPGHRIDRLRLLHRRRDAARGDRRAGGALAGAAFRAAAAAGRLTRHGMHDSVPGGRYRRGGEAARRACRCRLQRAAGAAAEPGAGAADRPGAPVAGGSARPAGRRAAAGHADDPARREGPTGWSWRAWLVLLRSRLLLPADAPRSRTAADAGGPAARPSARPCRRRRRSPRWLEDRPQLGRDVFARGQPELLGTALDVPHDGRCGRVPLGQPGAVRRRRGDARHHADVSPHWHELHSADDARARILRLLDEIPDGTPLGRFLPAGPERRGRGVAAPALRRRSAWSSTLVAGLELTRLGRLALQQTVSFGEIQVHAAASARAAEAEGAGKPGAGQGGWRNRCLTRRQISVRWH